jgi:hypothetical protein
MNYLLKRRLRHNIRGQRTKVGPEQLRAEGAKGTAKAAGRQDTTHAHVRMTL